MPFPKPADVHETPQIAAAADAARPTEPRRQTPLTPQQAEAHARLVAELTGEAEPEPDNNVVRLPETAKERYRRAYELEQRLAAGERVDSEDAVWLGGYQTTPEYRAHAAMLEDFGLGWLHAENKRAAGEPRPEWRPTERNKEA